MKAAGAQLLGEQIARLVAAEQVSRACVLLAPVLAERTPFRLLDRVGWEVRPLGQWTNSRGASVKSAWPEVKLCWADRRQLART